MNEKIVFVRTDSGEDEANSRTAHLSKDIKRALLMVDGVSSVAEILKRSSPSLRGMLEDMFSELMRGGFIRDKSSRPRSAPVQKQEDELDFTAAYRVPDTLSVQFEQQEAARIKDAARAREVEAARIKEAEAARIESARARDAEAASIKAAKAEAESLAEQARLETARVKNEQAAEKARLEAELARVQAAAEAESRARIEAEKQAKLLAEAARREAAAREAADRTKAEEAAAKAEAIRIKNEQAAEKVRLEAELARVQAAAEAESRARIEAEKQAKLLAEAARREAAAREEADRIKAEEAAARAEAVRIKNEQAAEKARLEAELARVQAAAELELRARIEAEKQAKLLADVALKEAAARQDADRIKAEQEAAELKARADAALMAERHTAKLKAEAEARALAIAEEKVRLENEVVKLRAQADAALAKAAADKADVQLRDASEREAREAEREREQAERALHASEEHARMASLQAELAASEAARAKLESERVQAGESSPRVWVERRQVEAAINGCDSRGGNNGVPIVERRTTTAAVLFFDIIGYTKQTDGHQLELKQKFSELLGRSLDSLEASERIILDTGDGAAVGFLQHPTDALEAAVYFYAGLVANKLKDDLRVRIGIHLGPVSLVKDMNGQINMLGDGINSAQRVMSFAGANQIYVSRPYFDFVSNLSDEYNDQFRYRGAQQDKHGREHHVYELLNEALDEQPLDTQDEGGLGQFNLDAFDAALSKAMPEVNVETSAKARVEDDLPTFDVADLLLKEAVDLAHAVEPEPVREPESAPESAPVSELAYSGEEARQVAEEQAKKWEEAGQRAAVKVVPPVAPVIEQMPKSVKPVKSARTVKRSRPIGKIAAGVFLLLLAALFILPVVLPAETYLPEVERMLGAKLQQPVHVGRLSGRILPTPSIELSEVSIGRQLQVKRLQANFAFSALFGEVRPVSSLDMDGLSIEGAALPQMVVWISQLAGDSRYPIASFNLISASLAGSGVSLSGIEGKLAFDGGKLKQGRLSLAGGKLELEMTPASNDKLHLAISVRNSALPLLPNWNFEDLKASGELSRDELRISDFDGRIKGGVLTGEALLNWRSGWRAQGSLTAKVIPLQNISKSLSGDMDGTARFQMQSSALAGLADTASLNGVFSVQKGMIGGVDLVETARLRSRESLPGGRTHFDALNGELYYANGGYVFRQLKLSDSVVKAGGAFSVSHQKLSGSLYADLAMKAGQVTLQLGGTADSPTLQAH